MCVHYEENAQRATRMHLMVVVHVWMYGCVDVCICACLHVCVCVCTVIAFRCACDSACAVAWGCVFVRMRVCVSELLRGFETANATVRILTHAYASERVPACQPSGTHNDMRTHSLTQTSHRDRLHIADRRHVRCEGIVKSART